MIMIAQRYIGHTADVFLFYWVYSPPPYSTSLLSAFYPSPSLPLSYNYNAIWWYKSVIQIHGDPLGHLEDRLNRIFSILVA
jgi:hypothetical protein